jgi:aryl-alcohol dehydrogenase-like predicted oxidoreductase
VALAIRRTAVTGGEEIDTAEMYADGGAERVPSDKKPLETR